MYRSNNYDSCPPQRSGGPPGGQAQKSGAYSNNYESQGGGGFVPDHLSPIVAGSNNGSFPGSRSESPAIEFIQDERENRFYEVLEFLGEGGFGIVYKVISQGELFAIKRLDKRKLSQAPALERRVKEEIAVHAALNHPSIVKLFHAFEDRNHINIVLEYCSGGDLGREIKNRTKFEERDARKVMAQVVEGVR